MSGASPPEAGLVRIDPARAVFRLGPDGDLRVEFLAACHLHLTLVRPFPWRRPDPWLSVRGADGREIGLLPGVEGLDRDSRAAVEHHLRQRYLVPVVTAITGIRDEAEGGRSGGLSWHLLTDRGAAVLHMPNTTDYIRDLGGGRVVLSDRAGNRLEIPQLEALDPVSRARLARFVWL